MALQMQQINVAMLQHEILADILLLESDFQENSHSYWLWMAAVAQNREPVFFHCGVQTEMEALLYFVTCAQYLCAEVSDKSFRGILRTVYHETDTVGFSLGSAQNPR